MNLKLSLRQMANEHGVLFKVVLAGGHILLGRVVEKGYWGGSVSSGRIRVYESYQQFEAGEGEEKREDVLIHEGNFIVAQRVTRETGTKSSAYEQILELDRDIQMFEDSYKDYGIIIRNLPDKLEALQAALAIFHQEQQTGNTEIVQELLKSHIAECRNCPPSSGSTAEEDQYYKLMTIRQAKYYSREAVIIALSRYVPPGVGRLSSVWQR
ncbi:MAG TPA: hypothetical protein VHE34_21265 [Puia sp.]|uniref:hypothetical protein n=1 Tax=Puia sp. TaxID=2045100 RepID=UPI002D10E1FB|nr:hypothetical protein [Puia sp.]HVU97774.1 hypothetical protein [Puia sp.]